MSQHASGWQDYGKSQKKEALKRTVEGSMDNLSPGVMAKALRDHAQELSDVMDERDVLREALRKVSRLTSHSYCHENYLRGYVRTAHKTANEALAKSERKQ